MKTQKFSEKLSRIFFGAKPDPFDPGTFRSVALIALFAWIGLGADGLSSSCYGPEQAFLVLGRHDHLGIYLAFATALTVFIISLGYNQVIELFPSGGGGYKVATTLLGPVLGLISGVALIVDYVLTIAISIASGADAVFSFLPTSAIPYQELVGYVTIIILIVLNLRGMKESIIVLLPIFFGFLIIHIGLIIYGVAAHSTGLPKVFTNAVTETHSMAAALGWFPVLALLLHSYSLGSGTYTGLEAVSNNVNRLAQPQVRTGKLTMLYMAVSLSFMASGIILLYLLWNAHFVYGQTLNAVVFRSILGPSTTGHAMLIITLLFEAGILFVAANTGFLAGPTVLANMSVGQWLPRRFQHLSTRLVMQNGVILFGVSAALILFWTHGSVKRLVIYYSINVFLTFTLTLLGLCVYWMKHRASASKHWRWRLAFSFIGFFITLSILLVVVISKFTDDGWISLLLTAVIVSLCLLIKRHYSNVTKKLNEINKKLMPPLKETKIHYAPIEADQPTAAFFVGKEQATAMHTLLWALRMFPNHFKNIVFIRVGEVDINSFRGETELQAMRKKVEHDIQYFMQYVQEHGFASKSFTSYGTDSVNQLMELSEKIVDEFPNTIFFSTKLIFENDNWFIRLLHNDTPITLQRRLHAIGQQLIILPMKLM